MIVNKYKSNEKFNECSICYNNFCVDEIYTQCKSCKKEFCKSCLKESMINYNSAFSFTGDVFNLQCPSCKNTIEFTTMVELFGTKFYYKELIPKMTDVKSKYLLTEKIKDLSIFITKNRKSSDDYDLINSHNVLQKNFNLVYEVNGQKIKYSTLAGKSYKCLFENYFNAKIGDDNKFYKHLLRTFVKIIDHRCILSNTSGFSFHLNFKKHVRLMENLKHNEPQTLIDYLLKQDGTFEEYMIDEKNETKIIDFIRRQYPEEKKYKILKIFSKLYSNKNIVPLKCYINEYYERIYLLLYISLHKTYAEKRLKYLEDCRHELKIFTDKKHSLNSSKSDFHAEFKCPSCELGFLNENYICNYCKSKFCNECLTVLNKDHKCKASDKATFKMIKETTKPCPKCACRIYRISGCNQMFCTTCHTGFDWVTGKIITKNFHNPHRMEWLNSLNKNESGTFVQGDIICGYQLTQLERKGIKPLQKLVNYRNMILNTIENQENKIREIEFEDMFSLFKFKEWFNYNENDFMRNVKNNIIKYNVLTTKNSIYGLLIEIINQLLVYFDQFYIQHSKNIRLKEIVIVELYHRIQPLLEFIDGYVKNICKMFSIGISVPEFFDSILENDYRIDLTEIKGSYKKYTNRYFIKHQIFDDLHDIPNNLSLDFDSSVIPNYADIIRKPNTLPRTHFAFVWRNDVDTIKKIPPKGENISDWNYIINCFKEYKNYSDILREIISRDHHTGNNRICDFIIDLVENEMSDNMRPLLNKLLNYYREFITLDIFIQLIATLVNKLYKKLSMNSLIENFFDYIEFCVIMSYKRCNLYFFYEIANVTANDNKLSTIKYDKEKHSQFAKIINDIKPLFKNYKKSLFNCF